MPIIIAATIPATNPIACIILELDNLALRKTVVH